MKHLAPVLLCLFLFSCNWYGAGSGYGILVISDSTAHKYKTSYLERYADTLLKKYPRYKIPESINRPILMQYPQENRTDTIYEYPGPINDICFFLPDPPREIYFIQWGGGTGFWIREVRDVDKNQTYVEYSGQPPVSDTLKKRIEQRFLKEIYARIDSLIVASPEYDSSLYKDSY